MIDGLADVQIPTMMNFEAQRTGMHFHDWTRSEEQLLGGTTHARELVAHVVDPLRIVDPANREPRDKAGEVMVDD